MPLRGLSVTRFERRGQPLASRRKFLIRMAIAIGLWIVLTIVGLAIGIAGYAAFEGMSFVDAYVNAAMILSGMGPMGELKTTGRQSVRRLLRDPVRSHHRHRHRIRAGADLPSHPAFLPRGDEDEGLRW